MRQLTEHHFLLISVLLYGFPPSPPLPKMLRPTFSLPFWFPSPVSFMLLRPTWFLLFFQHANSPAASNEEDLWFPQERGSERTRAHFSVITTLLTIFYPSCDSDFDARTTPWFPIRWHLNSELNSHLLALGNEGVLRQGWRLTCSSYQDEECRGREQIQTKHN